MLNRNFVMSAYVSISTGNASIKNLDGTITSTTTAFSSALKNFVNIKSNEMSGTTGQSTFVLGTSDTPASITDYSITDVDYTNFTIVSGSANALPTPTESAWQTHKKVYQQTWAYNGASEITIKEIGLLAYYYSFNSYRALAAREVLDSPITVNNGDTFTVSMVIG